LRPPDTGRAAFAQDVAHSLTQTPRQIPSRYLYDELGLSLFEAICRLPWYSIARTEQRLLTAHASAVFDRTGPISTIVELGPGSGEKLATLMTARSRRDVTVHLVDLSRPALDKAARVLAADPFLTIFTHQATYETGLSGLGHPGAAPGSTLVAFLGSNISNFDPPVTDAFLLAVRGALDAGDSLLLGMDLVRPERELLLAYDDPLGITAAFNRNLLVRINRELDADFDVNAFAHRAVWNAPASRIEMHLLSRRRQRVQVRTAGLDITLEEGESIWTESSYKYRPEDPAALLARAGFGVTGQWIEDGFALTLAGAL
jgi:dimethylhistidine N-methyltransferase